MGTQLPLPKMGTEPPIFGTCLLCPNGWIDQDATWYGGRPRPKRHCVRCGPCSPSPKKAHNPQFSAHVCCGQTAGWIKMPLGTMVGLGRGRIVLHVNAAPPPKRAQPPNFWPMSIVAKRSPISATAEHLSLAYENVHISSLSLAKLVRALFMGHMWTTG